MAPDAGVIPTRKISEERGMHPTSVKNNENYQENTIPGDPDAIPTRNQNIIEGSVLPTQPKHSEDLNHILTSTKTDCQETSNENDNNQNESEKSTVPKNTQELIHSTRQISSDSTGNTSTLPTSAKMSCPAHVIPSRLQKENTTLTNISERKNSPKRCEIRKNMKSEKERLLTYTNWPNPSMDPKELAKAGFYSTRYEDAVRCAFCNIEVSRWEEGDNAMADHQRWSNTCPFIRGHDVGNIPIDPTEKIDLPRPSPDTCGRYGIEIRPNSVPERSDILAKLGVTPNKSPNYPQYATVESRLNTFKEWPLSIKQKPDELADAGFFYISKGDQTMCFSCGGGLKDWLEGDDPWEQHARWFPKCSYVLMIKGREFVSEVCNRLPTAIVTPQQAADLRNEPGASNNKITETANNNNNNNNSSSKTAVAVDRKPDVVTNTNKSTNKESNKREKVDDGRLCKICYTEELGVVFLPCGHIVACVKCAPSLATCAVCRQPFSATVRAFLS